MTGEAAATGREMTKTERMYLVTGLLFGVCVTVFYLAYHPIDMRTHPAAPNIPSNVSGELVSLIRQLREENAVFLSSFKTINGEIKRHIDQIDKELTGLKASLTTTSTLVTRVTWAENFVFFILPCLAVVLVVIGLGFFIEGCKQKND